MTEEEKVELKWFEVTWTITAGLSKVKAASAEEAKKLASENADQADNEGTQKLADGRMVKHDWNDPTEEQVYISGVEEIDESEAADLDAWEDDEE